MSEETMKDFENMLEESYKMMGDGVHDTDQLLAWEKAKELEDSQENITVTISGIVKGGVVADFEGIRGFIPASRLSLEMVEDLNQFLLKEIEVRVFEADMEADKLILSAREILKERKLAATKKKLSEVEVGTVLQGTVATIKDYGAFVDLENGLSGLVHISQISHQRIKHPKVAVQEGQEVAVKVIEVKDGKLSLSIKALLEDPNAIEEVQEEAYEIPVAENIGTSMGDLFKNLKL